MSWGGLIRELLNPGAGKREQRRRARQKAKGKKPPAREPHFPTPVGVELQKLGLSKAKGANMIRSGITSDYVAVNGSRGVEVVHVTIHYNRERDSVVGLSIE